MAAPRRFCLRIATLALALLLAAPGAAAPAPPLADPPTTPRSPPPPPATRPPHLPPHPPKPPHPPPVPFRVDGTETVAVDIPWAEYASHAASYNKKFVKAWAVLLNIDPSQVIIQSIQNTTSGTQIIAFFNLDLPVQESTSSSSTTGFAPTPNCTGLFGCDQIADSVISRHGYHAVGSFFTSFTPGSAALPEAVVEMQRQGLPISGAWYIDIFVNSPPPPFTPPLAQWRFGDLGEAIAVDIPISVYAPMQEEYGRSFVLAMAQLVVCDAAAITIHDTQASSVGTTVIFFDFIDSSPDSSSSAVILAANARVASLFNGTAHTPGTPAYATVVATLRNAGMPVTAVFYGDQTVLTNNTAEVITNVPADFTIAGLTVALNIDYSAFATSALSYLDSFVVALAEALDTTQDVLQVTGYLPAGAGNGTLVAFSFLSPTTTSSEALSSSAVVLSGNAKFMTLFESADLGAAAKPSLLTLLQRYGLPVTQAFLDDLPAAGR